MTFKFKSRLNLLITILLIALVMGANESRLFATPQDPQNKSHVKENGDCGGLLRDQSSSNKSSDGLLFPYGVTATNDPVGYFMFGVEVEYALTPDLSPNVLLSYAPSADLVPRDQWLKTMSPGDRVTWIKEHLSELFPDGPKHKSGLLRVSDDASLPDSLILDSTGNVELVSQPFNSYSEFEKYLDRLNQQFGEGYLQASISVPGYIIYQSAAAAASYIGMRLFVGEYDMLAKLKDGWEKHEKTPAYTPAKNFTHPYLGPTNSNRVNFFRRVVDENRDGRFNSDILSRVSSLDSSYKYTSQVAYRPDILGKQTRFINEIRDCVKSYDCIKARVQREIALFQSPLRDFGRFAALRTMDPIADFNLFPENVQVMLRTIFPPKPPIPSDDGAEILASEVYRNMAYPLQDWGQWFAAFGISPRSELQVQVKAAQLDYIQDVSTIADDLAAKKISDKAAGDAVRLALARFTVNSQIFQSFDSWAKQHIAKYDPSLWE